jgi:hypothetical protein
MRPTMFDRHDFIYDTLRVGDRERSRQAAQRFQVLQAVREQRRQQRQLARPVRQQRRYAVRRTA